MRCFRLWENCSKEQVEVFHDRLRLTTTDVACQVWQNRRDRAPGNNLPFGERMAKHRSSEGEDLGSKTWARVTQSERPHVSWPQETALPGGSHHPEQGWAALGVLCATPLCTVSSSYILLLAIRWVLLVTLNSSALELTPWKTEKLLLQSYYFYLGISTQRRLIS